MLKILRRAGIASTAAAALLVGGIGVTHASMTPIASFQFHGPAYTTASFVAVGPLPGSAIPCPEGQSLALSTMHSGPSGNVFRCHNCQRRPLSF